MNSLFYLDPETNDYYFDLTKKHISKDFLFISEHGYCHIPCLSSDMLKRLHIIERQYKNRFKKIFVTNYYFPEEENSNSLEEHLFSRNYTLITSDTQNQMYLSKKENQKSIKEVYKLIETKPEEIEVDFKLIFPNEDFSFYEHRNYSFNIIKKDEKPIGIFIDFTFRKSSFICWFGIFESVRGEKLSEDIFMSCINYRRKRNINSFFLQVNNSNDIAKKIFGNLGFKEQWTRKTYSKTLED